MPRVLYTPEQIATVDNRIRRTCHSRQRAFAFDDARKVSCLVGRGGGKTTGALMRILRRMVGTPDANCLFIAATRISAEKLVWRDLKRIVDDSLRLSGRKFNESDLVLELPNGSRLMLVGCDDKSDINKLRGLTYHEVVVDEVGSIKIGLLDELLVEVIGPRMVGAICLIGTPGKDLRGMFYDATRPGSDKHRPWTDRKLPEFAGWTNWSSHRWTVFDGAEEGISAMQEFLVVAQLNKADEGWSDDNPRWRREYLGEWAADDSSNVYIYRPHDEAGKPWNQWDPKLSAFGVAVLPDTFKDWGYVIGIDVGFTDAFALEIFAFSYTDPTRTLFHVYEIYRTKLYANAIAKLLIGEDLNHDRYRGIIGEIGWPDAMVGDFAGRGGDLLKELSTVYGVTVVAADKPYKYKDNAVELVNSDFFEGRIKVMKGSNLEKELLSLQWTVDQYGKRLESKNQANHACDAMLYATRAAAPLLPSAIASGATEAATKPSRQQREDDDMPTPEQAYGDADSLYQEW